MTYCTNCGNQLEAGVLFCTRCGGSTFPPVAPHAPQPIVPQTQSTPAPLSAPVAASTGPATAKGGCGKFILAAVVVLVVVAALGIGGVVYVGINVKQKATSFAAKVTSPTYVPSPNPDKSSEAKNGHQESGEQLLNGLAGLLQGKQGTDKGDVVPTISQKDAIVPCSPGTMHSQNDARIPLRKGTVVTTAWGITKGDVEVRNTVTAVDDTGFTDTASNGTYVNDNGENTLAANDTNIVCSEDLSEATTYTTGTWHRFPKILHSLTRLRISDRTFQEIQKAGHMHLAYEGFKSVDEERLAPEFDDGDLVWTEKQDVAYPLIVNDQRVTVPAIHLTGTFDVHGKDPRPMRDRPLHVPTELFVLDDPLDPLVLLLKMTAPQYHNGRYRIEVTSVSYEVPHPVNLVEKQLTEQKRAITYGIYFDFNKDTIKPESEPVLKQIVQAMTDNPDWKLTVNGHTDNIGGDAYNLDLSKRRAAAVKETLVDRYHIAPGRLSTNGYGVSSPIDTNETLEGRARNRRVELTRE
jgi:outer membrane protein OmpA-like peptidoglycan-associated protein